MADTERPVFIIGGSRTGSEMLKTMLSKSNELGFVDELFLLCPRWLHRDLNSHIRSDVGDLTDPGAVDRLIDLLYSGKPFGWFFAVGIHELDRDMLRAELHRGHLDLKNVFRSIMVVHSRMREKSGIGAKFPLHYSYTEKLLEWFPNCLLIHTTRNPKATYASQAAKYLRNDINAISKNMMRFKQFVHINIQISWTAHLHNKLKYLPNYMLVRYEDVVLQPEIEIRRVCGFLGTEFVPAMLSPHQYGSSFGTIRGGTGVNPSSLERWRTTLRPMTARALDLLHPTAYEIFGYRSQE